MTKKQKFYCKLGQAVCNVTSALIFFAVPMAACWLAGYIANIIL